jgi:hypothetical protein
MSTITGRDAWGTLPKGGGTPIDETKKLFNIRDSGQRKDNRLRQLLPNNTFPRRRSYHRVGA